MRDSAITRRNDCRSIAWKTLRRPRLFIWVGQWLKQTRWTKEWTTNVCETDNFVPLVVQGFSTSSWSNSSSTSTSQDLSSTSPAQERSDGLTPTRVVRITLKNLNKNEKRDGSWDADDRLRYLPEWLQEFRDNVEDTEMLAPAHISQDSDSERLTKVVTRRHSILTHFLKDRNCEVYLRTKMTRALCRRRTGEAPIRAEKFGDLITADHKVFNEYGDSRNSHRYAVVVQDLASHRVQSYPCKTKTSPETEKSLRKFLEPSKKPKFLLRTNHWNLENIVKVYHGIMGLQHLIDPRHMASLKGPYDEWKKEFQEYCYNRDWIKNGGLILWNATPICETFKISCLMGKLHKKGVLENHLKDKLFHLVHWLSITL